MSRVGTNFVVSGFAVLMFQFEVRTTCVPFVDEAKNLIHLHEAMLLQKR